MALTALYGSFYLSSIIQFIPAISSVTPTSWMPLLFVLVVNMIKEGIEDAKRGKQDKQINNKLVAGIAPETKKMEMLKW